jgi:NAD(P)-dependent dehydrogenase (short-subunit alcohol dehydrogenase family)
MTQQATIEPERQNAASLSGRVALVTGGARGLGRAIAETLCEAGATVVIADFRRELGAETASQICSGGGSARAVHLDLRDQEAVAGTVQAIAEESGRLDFVINNAGIDKTVGLEDMAIEDWDNICATNLRAPFLVAKHAFPLMRAQGGGHIVNIVSTASKRTWANASAYHATKWGLLGFSHAIHVEGRSHGIKVTAVVAGGMRTPFLFERFPDLDPSVLQDVRHVAETVRFVLTQPAETVIPEVMVLPMKETSWP